MKLDNLSTGPLGGYCRPYALFAIVFAAIFGSALMAHLRVGLRPVTRLRPHPGSSIYLSHFSFWGIFLLFKLSWTHSGIDIDILLVSYQIGNLFGRLIAC